jgi:DNA repair exonuclease SbcCD ATPase subunit
MKLRRLRIENLRRFREPLTLEGFADGLNLFAAPNEAGKSTVAEALRAAFFERHRSSSVEHLRPWGDTVATPTVEVDFDVDGRRYQLTKAFLGRRRCELRIQGQPALDGAAAEDHLAQLLGFRFPGKGASAPEHRGIPGLLWVRQGTSHDLAPAVAHAADHLRQVLGSSLGELTASGGDALLRAVESSRQELLTPATGQPKGEYATALQRRDRLVALCESLDRDIAAYQGTVDRLATLRREQARDAQSRPWEAVREQHRAAMVRLEQAQGLEARLRSEREALQRWQASAASRRAELEALSRDDAAVLARQQALPAREAAEQAALAEVQAWERRHAEAAAAQQQAAQALEQLRAQARRAALQRSAAEVEADLASRDAVLARARDERTRGARLLAEAQTLLVPPADLQGLRTLSDACRELDLKLEAAATTLDFDLLPGQQLRLDGETLEGQGRRTLPSRAELLIEGVGRLTVLPGGRDSAALATKRERTAAELAALLQALGVAHVAEAEERARQAAQRQQEARASQTVLAALAPQGVEALEAEQAARSARAQGLRAALAALPPADADEPVRPDLAAAETQAQAQAERAAQALDAAAQSLGRARVAAGKAQSDLAAARQELAAALATVQSADRAARLAAARQALIDATAQEAAAQQQAAATAAELQQVNRTVLQQDVERLALSARQLEDSHERRRQDISRLEIELETKGAMGLEEQRAETVREREAATRRAGELARRAAALDHLLTVLRDQRTALARRLRAPLQRHLDHYLGILLPGAHIEVGDDLSPGAVVRSGPRGPESGAFDELSLGTREQMGIVARLAYADLLQEAGRPTLLILDDALVHTDEDRLGQMKRVLYDAARRHQVLVFTCHPAAWRDLGVEARGLAAG